MNLGKYLLTLLPEHDTVIIPRLGAFITVYKPAGFNEETGELSPPSSEVKFDRNIKHNDGLLAGHIASVENVSLAEANKRIEEEREEIIYRLDKGQTVTIDDLGVLNYGPGREIVFTYTGTDNLLMEAFGLGTTTLDKAPEIEEEIPEPPVVEEEDEVVAEEKDMADGPFQEPEPVPYEHISLRDAGDVPDRRKRHKAWWLLLFLIPVIGAGFYFLFLQPGKKQQSIQVNVEQPAPAPVEPAPADTIDAGEAVAENVNPVSSDSIRIVRPNHQTFYLIRGSFEEFEKSKKYIFELREKNYKPFHLGKHGSFWLVGIDSFKNKTEAYGQQYNYLDKFPDSGVWIFIPDSI